MMDKELVWLPKDVAKKVIDAESESAQLTAIQEYLDSTKRSMSGDLEAMEEDAIRFKGMLLSYKKAYKEALDVHCEATYKTWEDINKTLPNMKQKAESLIKDLDAVFPVMERIESTLDKIAEKFNSINIYQLKEMISLIEKISYTDDKTKDFILKAFSK